MNAQDRLRAMIETASATAERVFNKHGRIAPCWIMIDGHGREHIIPPMCDDKDLNVALVRAAFELLGAKRYVFMDEAWMLDRRGITPEKAAAIGDEMERAQVEGIADHPERIEIVMFTAEDEEAGQAMAHREIKRPASGRAYLDPLQWINDPGISQGRMIGLLPQKGARN